MSVTTALFISHIDGTVDTTYTAVPIVSNELLARSHLDINLDLLCDSDLAAMLKYSHQQRSKQQENGSRLASEKRSGP